MKLQIKPRKNSEAPTGFKSLTSAMLYRLSYEASPVAGQVRVQFIHVIWREWRDFFLGFICNCLSYFRTAKISFTSILYLQDLVSYARIIRRHLHLLNFFFLFTRYWYVISFSCTALLLVVVRCESTSINALPAPEPVCCVIKISYKMFNHKNYNFLKFDWSINFCILY